MVEPGSVYLQKNVKNELINTSEIIPNKLYSNVYVYDYTNYYTIEMQQYDDDFTFGLSEKSKNFPSPLKSELFKSEYYLGGSNLIQKLFNQNKCIEITNNVIKTIGEAQDETGSLVVLDRYNYLLTLGKVSFIAENHLGQIIKVGTAKVIKPKFKLGVDFLDLCLKYLFGGKIGISNNLEIPILPEKPKLPDLSLVSPQDLVLTIKIKDISEYPVGTLKFKLAQQLNKSISTWTNVKYYMTTRGPVLEELIQSSDVIDSDFYKKELQGISKILNYK
jgi:hypothetical protein